MSHYIEHDLDFSFDSLDLSDSFDEQQHRTSYSDILENEKDKQFSQAPGVGSYGSIDEPSTPSSNHTPTSEERQKISGQTKFSSYGPTGKLLFSSSSSSRPPKPLSSRSTPPSEGRRETCDWRDKQRRSLQRLLLDDSVLSDPSSSVSSSDAAVYPGAYVVNGSGEAMRCSTGGNGENPTVATKNTIDGHRMGLQLPQATAITAELAIDVEVEVERRLRKKILQDAAQAAVVPSCVPSLLTSTTGYSSHNIPVDLDENFYRPRGVKEKLFGDGRRVEFGYDDIAAAPDRCIKKRQFLPVEVKGHQQTSHSRSVQWRVTIQTSQRAVETNHLLKIERGERLFSVASEFDAHELAQALAVPKQDPLHENPICFLCRSKFAVLRPSRHCCNCGVVICAKCSCHWPAKMLPDTYGIRKDATGNVCLACDWSARQFQAALLEGDADKAMNLYRSGNVNLRTQYCLDKKAEIMYPVHMAILGGNIDLLHWLTRRRCCPIKDPTEPQGRLLTSRGRSPLTLAFGSLTLLQYLVTEHGLDVRHEKNLHYETMLSHLAALLEAPARSKNEASQNDIQRRGSEETSWICGPAVDKSRHYADTFPQQVPQCRKTASQRMTPRDSATTDCVDFDEQSTRRGSF